MKTRISTSLELERRSPTRRVPGVLPQCRVGDRRSSPRSDRGQDARADRLEARPTTQRGVALVITLILLAVITTLAIAFLALTYRETAAVDSLARTTDSEMACDSALERAKAEILAPFARNDTNNAYKFPWATNGIETMGPDFMVSVAWNNNWLAPQGMIVNPSPPVFVNTNRSSGPAGLFENRFYLDLNRNGYFEDTGFVTNTVDAKVNGVFQPEFIGGNPVVNWRVGDPQWIGVLQDPRRPHTNDNRFIYRYAFLVQPIGRSLDVNWIHNQALRGNNMLAGFNGFYRNQGVGTWELNLAGFLADLNANYWGNQPRNDYVFDPFNPAFPNAVAFGASFNDARDLLRYRYTPQNWNFFAPPFSPHISNDTFFTLAPAASAAFASDYIDGYADGPLALPSRVPSEDDDTSRPWPGADSRRHYFSVHDLFDGNKLPEPTGFTNKLTSASQQGNSYDRYTYYRMLSQMGTDSEAEREDEGKININYVNIPSWKDGRRYPPTNFWFQTDQTFTNLMGRPGPELFLLTVATNLFLREPALAFIVTNPPPPGISLTPLRIPIYTNRAFGGAFSTITTNFPLPGPLYAGRIHQILQLAANIHEATAGPKQGETVPYFPSVFRPRFERANNGDVYITDYTLVGLAGEVTPPAMWKDLDAGDSLSPNDLVYGIPLIIGARKGFPNFNEVAVMTTAEATRKLTVFRSVSNAEPHTIEQDFSLKVRTRIQIEARNPWDRTNARPLQLMVQLNAGLQVSNSPVAVPNRVWSVLPLPYNYPLYPTPGYWPGESKDAGAQRPTNSYVLSPVFETNVMDWLIRQNVLNSTTNLSTNFAVTINNRLNFYILDGGRIVDFVTLNRPRNLFEIGKKMDEDLQDNNGLLARIWSSARDQAYNTLGIRNQVSISQNGYSVPNEVWGDYLGTDVPSKTAAAQKFAKFMADKEVGTNQAPFTPTRLIVQANYYQVDDPLVHYTFEDLRNDTTREVYGTERLTSARTNLSVCMGQPNANAFPWNKGEFGMPDGTTSIPGEGTLDPRLRDPGLIHPEYWDFPTSLFANVGWLGRVHRGTPWQSIYLKSRAPASASVWNEHSGNQRSQNSANLMVPTRDWELLDIFTTAPHPNATRGRLSINQTNLAAWSAVLAGAVTSETIAHPEGIPGFSASTNVVMTPAAVDPAADPAVELIVEGINRQRELVSSNRYNGYLFAPFNKLSDLMSTPELSEGSPYLNVDPNLLNAFMPSGTAVITDADYERIPQQILSLVKLGEPRFVVYAWGQSLKPARRNPEDTGPSIVTSGPDRGLCRNYQITGEMATRAVIRVEFDRITDPLSPQFNQLDYSRPRAVVESFNLLPVE